MVGKVKSYLPQLAAAAAATSCLISDGMHFAWPSPVLPLLFRPDSPVLMTESMAQWLELCYLMGGLLGLPFTMWSLVRFGRKKSIMMGAVCSLIAWIMIASANVAEVMLAARMLAGVAGNVVFVSLPMYISEISHENIRGLLIGFINIVMLTGVIVCYSIAPFVSVLTSACVAAIFPIVQLASMSFMPETPYYHFINKKEDQAKKSLQWLRNRDDVDDEYMDIKAAVERQSKERGSFKDIFTVKSNRKAFLIILVLNSGQHLSSIAVMLMNMHAILGEAESKLDTNTAAILFSVIMCISCIVSAFLVDKLGRKILLCGSSFACAIALGCLASFLTLKHLSYDVQNITWLPVASVFLYAAVFRLGLGSIPLVLVGEIFPTSIKSKGMTITDATWGTSGTLVLYLYQFMESTYGRYSAFWLFTCSCILMVLFGAFVVPETKGKTLEEIQFILKGEVYVKPSTAEKEKQSLDIQEKF